MSTEIVIFYPERCVPAMAQTAQIGFDSIFLVAGTNTLTQDVSEKLKKHPDFSRFVELGAIEIVGEQPAEIDPLANTEIPNLLGFKEAEAVKILNNTNNVETLESWLEAEQRPKIRTALNTRITQLKSGAV